ncbi:hypothetical protein ACLBWP_03330 [Microbacterium sp. M1A1_1b]
MADQNDIVTVHGTEYKRGDAIRLGLLPLSTGPENPNATPTEKWKGEEIDTFAADHGIDLGTATTKAEKVAVIDAAAGRQQEHGTN